MDPNNSKDELEVKVYIDGKEYKYYNVSWKTYVGRFNILTVGPKIKYPGRYNIKR